MKRKILLCTLIVCIVFVFVACVGSGGGITSETESGVQGSAQTSESLSESENGSTESESQPSESEGQTSESESHPSTDENESSLPPEVEFPDVSLS